jgi:hypothetical protein
VESPRSYANHVNVRESGITIKSLEGGTCCRSEGNFFKEVLKPGRHYFMKFEFQIVKIVDETFEFLFQTDYRCIVMLLYHFSNKNSSSRDEFSLIFQEFLWNFKFLFCFCNAHVKYFSTAKFKF